MYRSCASPWLTPVDPRTCPPTSLPHLRAQTLSCRKGFRNLAHSLSLRSPSSPAGNCRRTCSAFRMSFMTQKKSPHLAKIRFAIQSTTQPLVDAHKLLLLRRCHIQLWPPRHPLRALPAATNRLSAIVPLQTAATLFIRIAPPLATTPIFLSLALVGRPASVDLQVGHPPDHRRPPQDPSKASTGSFPSRLPRT